MNIIIVCIVSVFIATATIGCSMNNQEQERVEIRRVEDGVLMQTDNIEMDSQEINKSRLNQTPIELGENINMVAYIAFKEDKLIIDQVELIKLKDTNRLRQIDVNASKEMPNGDRLYNESKELLEIVISPNVIYRFTDKNRIYEKKDIDKIYETDKLEQFYKASAYKKGTSVNQQTTPYFIEIIDGKVAKVTEEYIYVK